MERGPTIELTGVKASMYIHSGLLLQPVQGGKPMVMELVNSEEKAVLQISSLEDFSLRGKSWGGGGMVVTAVR